MFDMTKRIIKVYLVIPKKQMIAKYCSFCCSYLCFEFTGIPQIIFLPIIGLPSSGSSRSRYHRIKIHGSTF
jgi:hypothetical protein